MKHALAIQLQREPSAIHLTHSFSICGSELPRTRLGWLRAILHQLILQAPEAFDDMKDRFQRIQDALPSKQQVTWGAQELYEDLTKAIAKILKSRSVFMFVDGIDWSEGETAAKLVQDFSKLLEKSQPKQSTKEPSAIHGLKIIFSSTLFHAKEPFPQSYINVDEKNGPSLTQFLEGQLSTTDPNTRQLVLSKSGSSFISARLIINHIKLFGPIQSSLVQQPSPTPVPVSFLLGDYFQNMAQQGNESLRSLLSWVCLATRPLTLAELRVALSLDMIPKLEQIRDLSQAEPFSRYSSDESFQSWIKTTSWGLLETVNLRGQKVVKVMHDSIPSFFLSKGLAIITYNSQPLESANSPLQLAHSSLATNLLRYLVLITKESKSSKDAHKEPTFELLGYAGTNWSNHISAAGLAKPDASKILKLMQWPSENAMNTLVRWDQENHAVGELQGTLWAHIFAVYGHAPLLSVALKKAGNEALGLLDNQKRTPLHHSALHGHLAASKQLLKSGAMADARAANGQTALHYAVIQGHQSILKPLMDSDPGLVFATNHLAQTPLHLSVIRGTSSAVKLLLERRADVKALDRNKFSVLHHAVGTDKSSLLKLLLDSGAEIDLQNSHGHTPLHLAISEKRPAIIKLLLERGCRVDIQDMSGRTALHMTAASGEKSCAQELLKRKVAIDTKDRDGQTALVYAVEGLHTNLIKLLLESNTDVNARNKQGFNVLMLAVRVNHEKVTKLLLGADPDLDALSSEGHTVIFYAVYRGKAVSLLSEKEQLVASLLLKHYKKNHVVWNAEWIACKEKFMAEHGERNIDAKLKLKLKAESKKTAASPSVSVAHKNQVRKPLNGTSEDVPKPRKGTNVSAPKPSTPVAEAKQYVRPDPKVSPKPGRKVDHEAHLKTAAHVFHDNHPEASVKVDHNPDTKPRFAATTQNHTAATSYSPFKSSNPMVSSPLPQRPTTTQNSSVPMSTENHQKQQNSTFMPFQPPQSTIGNPVHNGFNTVSEGPTGQQVPIEHRSSWDMYTALSSNPPVSAHTKPTRSKSPYIPYSGVSQQSPGGGSFKPFQPFQPSVSHGSPSNTLPQPKRQSDDRFSFSSQSSYIQGQNSSSKQATQQGINQGYQPLSVNPQTRSMASPQPQVPQRKSVDSSIKPAAPLSIGRKPVVGQPGQPIIAAPDKSSYPSRVQASQSPAGMIPATHCKSQAQSGVVSPLPNTPQAAPGKQSIAPFASQNSISAQYRAPSHNVVASARPAQASGQKPVQQNVTVSRPYTQQQPAATQKPVAAQQSALVQKHPHGQAASSQKPASAQQPGSIAKPSPTQKPAPTQQVTPNEKTVPSGSVATSGKPTLVQKSDSPVHKRPAPPSAHPSGYSSRTQSTSGQRSVETYTQSQDIKHSRFGKGKVVAATGAGVLAGATGGYFLSNYVQDHNHYESNYINNEGLGSDNGQYQPIPPTNYAENYYLGTQAEPSEHSEEEEESDHGGKSDDESDDNDSISFSVEASDADNSSDQAFLDDGDDDLDGIDSDSDEGGDEDEFEDDVESLDFDQDEPDSPDVDTDVTDDDDDTGEISDIHIGDDDDDDDASEEDASLHYMQEESDNGLDTDSGQDDSDSDGDVGQDFDSDEDNDSEPEHFHAHYQQQIVDQSDSENEGHEGQYGNFQHQIVSGSDSEDEIQQSHFQEPYQQQTIDQESDEEEEPDYYENNQQQGHFQQQTFQEPDSDDEDQPAHYTYHQKQVYQSDSEDEGEVQQNNYYNQHQHQAQSGFDEDSDDQIDVDSDDEVDEQTGYDERGNGYSQQSYGDYEGAEYDSDY